jgi:hypothetical protein
MFTPQVCFSVCMCRSCVCVCVCVVSVSVRVSVFVCLCFLAHLAEIHSACMSVLFLYTYECVMESNYMIRSSFRTCGLYASGCVHEYPSVHTANIRLDAF